jgi:hypothetical protein
MRRRSFHHHRADIKKDTIKNLAGVHQEGLGSRPVRR